jgi:hypothetical protein
MKTGTASDPGDEPPRYSIMFDRAIYSRPDDDHVQDLAAVAGSLKAGTAVHADSGVDFVVVLNGQTILGEAKKYVQPDQSTRPPVLAGALILFVCIAATVYLGFTHPTWLAYMAAGAGTSFLTKVAARAAKKKWGDEALARFSAHSLTDLAALLAGRRRPALRAEWRTHLAGESGHDPANWAKVKDALGFVASALHCRWTDTADVAWTPVDAILKSRKLSNLLVFVPTVAAAMYILRHLGTLGVITSAEGISAIGGGLYGLIRVGRWWRDVEPPEPKARRAKEQ